MFENFPDDLDFTSDELMTICISGVGAVVFVFCCGIYCCSDGARGRYSGRSVPFGGVQGDYKYGMAADSSQKLDGVEEAKEAPIVFESLEHKTTARTVSPSRSWKAYISGTSSATKKSGRRQKDKDTLPRPPPTTANKARSSSSRDSARPPLLPREMKRPWTLSNEKAPAPDAHRPVDDPGAAAAADTSSGARRSKERPKARVEGTVEEPRRSRDRSTGGAAGTRAGSRGGDTRRSRGHESAAVVEAGETGNVGGTVDRPRTTVAAAAAARRGIRK